MGARTCVVLYVFLINGLAGGGAERVLQVLANHYAGQSKPVVVLTLESPRSDYEFDPRITIRQVLPIPDWAWARNWVLPAQLLALCWWLHILKPSFCFSLLARSNFLNILAGRAVRRVRCSISEHIHSVHEFSTGSWRSVVAIKLIQALYPLAGDIFCVSRGVKECLIGLGVRHSRMHVIPNPINISPLGYDAEEWVAAKRLTVITVGRLAVQKDQETLIRAFHSVCHRHDMDLLVLGEGPLRSELTRLVEELGLQNRVHLMGWVDDVFEHLRKADIFMLSSRWEGFGNVLVEAMACALPVICTDCASGPQEILQGGKYGLLVPVGDTRALGQALDRLAGSPELRRSYAQLSLKRAACFGVEGIAARYEELLGVGK